MAVIIKVRFFLTELHSRFKMSDVSMMIRKQEKKLTEVLMKKTHFSFGEIGKAPTFQPMGGSEANVGVQLYTRGLTLIYVDKHNSIINDKFNCQVYRTSGVIFFIDYCTAIRDT
jgi:hypothetical protein